MITININFSSCKEEEINQAVSTVSLATTPDDAFLGIDSIAPLEDFIDEEELYDAIETPDFSSHPGMESDNAETPMDDEEFASVEEDTKTTS